MALTQISQAGAKDEAINEAKIQISNAGTNGQFLQKQSGNTGGLTWADVPAGVGGSNGADFNDNVKVRLGTGNDLEIFHENSFNTSRINSTTGNIEIRHTVSGADEAMAKFIPNGAVQLYHNGTKKLETTSTGVSLDDYLFLTGDGKEIRMGAGGDLRLYHDGTNSYIDNNTGELHIRLNAWPSQEKGIVLVPNGTVELYYDHSKKLHTTSAGVYVTGDLQLTGANYDVKWDNANNKFIFNDSARAVFGTGSDLAIQHDGTDTSIKNITGELQIRGDTLVLAASSAYEKYLTGTYNGAVELYYDNSKKVETYSNGLQLNAQNNVWIQDNGKLVIGAGSDLQIYHDGTDTIFKNHTTGSVIHRARTNWIVKTNATDGGADDAIKALQNGAVELYYDNSKKLETYASGVYVYDYLFLHDNDKLICGHGSDLQIYHNGTHSYVENSTGNLLLRPKSGEDGVTIIPDGSVNLAYDDAKKLSTKSHGVDVTDGELRIGDADDGNDALIRLGATGTNTDTHAVIYYDKSSNYLSMVVSGESHGTNGLMIENGGNVRTDDIIPHSNNTYNLGSSSVRWANIYTNDLNLSNKGSSNEVDGTWGNYTIQEGEDDLFLINRRNGKKYKFNLTEIS